MWVILCPLSITKRWLVECRRKNFETKSSFGSVKTYETIKQEAGGAGEGERNRRGMVRGLEERARARARCFNGNYAD